VNRNHLSSPIDKQLLARLVLLPKHDINLAPPLLIVVAEVAVAVTVGMRLSVLDPEQLQRQINLGCFLDLWLSEIWFAVLCVPTRTNV
jgi:hypothetical protein